MSSGTEKLSPKVKTIYLKLNNYQQVEGDDEGAAEDNNWVGRDRLIKYLKRLIREESIGNSAYLITGYRGIGKTSLIRKSVQEVQEKSSPEKTFSDASTGPIMMVIVAILLLTLLLCHVASEPPKCAFLCSLLTDIKTDWPFLTKLCKLFMLCAFIYFLPVIILFFKDYTQWLVQVNKEKNDYRSFEIALSQDDVTEKDVFSQVTQQLLRWYNEVTPVAVLDRRAIYFPLRLLVNLAGSGRSDEDRHRYQMIGARLKNLNDRLYGEVSSNQELAVEPSLRKQVGITNLAVSSSLFRYSQNNQVSYALASAKEIEAELMFLLKDFAALRSTQQNTPTKFPKIPKFVFILDELDKMEPAGNMAEYDDNREIGSISINNSRLRQRQDVVGKLLGNLKSFLNTAPATFFFIGGRELYDAALADIADRDSFYSSIFSDVIYVSSFFKEKVYPDSSDLTDATEKYLTQLILGKSNQNIPQKLDEITALKGNPKLYDLLKNYVIYLTYRSNGTPKKLISLVEDIIVKSDNIVHERGEKIELYDLARKDKISATLEENAWYLKFTFQKQFELSLTADLYRPYLATNSTYVKSYGDKLLFSSAFIMDHLLKFHAFGFSWRNLETIPEVILGNSDPHLRSFLEKLVSYLSFNYIRPTISGLFQYKFYSEISQEISLLAKLSEESAAAFTFTLDESRQVKRHYKLKLRELELKHGQYQPAEGMNRYIHSVGFVQTILGDLHFYDQEFEDAVIYYTDSIQTLRFPTHRHFSITSHQVFLWVTNMLKLSLSLEKMKAFDSAYSIYQTVINDIPQYSNWLKEQYGSTAYRHSEKDPFSSYRNLQLLNIPFLAKLALIEKYRFGGISQDDLKDARIGLYELLVHDDANTTAREIKKIEARRRSWQEEHPRPDARATVRKEEYVEHKIHRLRNPRHLFLFADYYHNLGTLLFFKNNSVEAEDRTKWQYIMQLYYPEVAGYLNNLDVEKESKTNTELTQDYRPSIIAYYNYKKALWLLLRTHLEDRLNQKIIQKLLLEDVPNELLFDKAKEIIKEVKLSKDKKNLREAYLASGYFERETSEESSRLSLILQAYQSFSLEKAAEKAEAAKALIRWFIRRFPNYDLFSQTFLLLHNKFRSKWNVSLLFYGANLWSKLGDSTIASMPMIVDWRNKEVANTYSATLKLLHDSLKDTRSHSKGVAAEKKDLSYRQQWAQRLFFQPAENSLEFSESAVSLYYVSSLYYQSASKPYSAAFQLYKILWVIYFSVRLSPLKRDDPDTFSGKEEIIEACREINKSISWIIGVSTTSDHRTAHGTEKVGQHRSNIDYAALLMANRIYRLLGEDSDLSVFEHVHLENSPFIRMHYLREVNAELYQEWKKGTDTNGTMNDKAHGVSREKLLQRGLYFCHEIITTLNKYGATYNVLQSQIGDAHYQMARWCELYHELVAAPKNDHPKPDGQEQSVNIADRVKSFFGRDYPGAHRLNPEHHYRKAIQHFYKGIHTHTENQEYQGLIAEMYFLEDDFNDNLYHFNAALERVYVNSGILRQNIASCKEALNRLQPDQEK